MKNIYRMLVFAEVVQTGSFTRAAESLGHTRSGVSQHISLLEDELGVRLMNRSTRRISLTEEGRVFARRCQSIKALVNISFEEIQSQASSPEGPLVITAPHAFENQLVLPTLTQLYKLFPKIEPKLMINDQRLDLLSHKIDIAISVGTLPDSNYKARKLGELTEIFCVAPAKLEQLGKINQPEQLAALPHIATSWQEKRKQQTLLWNGEKIKLKLQHRFRVNTLPSAVNIAEQALGIALLPDIYAKDFIKQGKLVQVFPYVSTEPREVYCVHPYSQQVPLKVRTYINLLIDRMNIDRNS
ncbi:LysR family transcriptional regulator [Endozoicomonas sp. SM1973]|uniref:LysR family transcriptional regulator n=1 Tax=Spartinivicinus marinus TaxID=2994442 RepID=A0A853I908_9GAMM|nr:LysR family transcriptional regulator [Spartinivicinus marinus]MCX4027533.1 LysR family transcriptional regulator [Spartinivicinus marinus]NYZ68222.1 LysR family transcriptional regulator [Spartinivicinus marinus]